MTGDWHIMGAGAIGSLFASSFARAGISTTLLLRSGNNEARVREIRIEKNGVTQNLSFPISYNDEADLISHLLVATKAYDVRTALSEIAHRLNSRSNIFVLVNGMGYLEEMSADYPHLGFNPGTTTEGVYRLEKNHFCHAGDGLTRFGRREKTDPPACFNEWSTLDLPTLWEANIEECLWQKLAINCAINPMTTVHRCKNGELAEAPDLAHQVNLLCDEISQVSTAAGFANTAANIHRWTADVIAGTANNRSSMLQDILAGRQTENHYISGYLLKVASRFKVAAPLNEAIFEKICEIDRGGNKPHLL
jgi:2-dehydropantoate 2-reductase